MSVSLSFLVPTKMVAPHPGVTWIRREQLLERLGSWPTTKLTTVIASAGFGKSTLVAQWLAHGERSTRPSVAPALRFVWLTLDEHDQDGVQVLAYLVAAIEQIAPQTLTTTTTLLLAAETPPLYVLVQALLVDLNALAFDLVIVLDDYHAITSEAVHQAVMYLLRHSPPHCRLVIRSRIDPPLQVARLRAEQQITEVRTADLRFSEAESRVLFDHLLGGSPDPTLVSTLHQQTEGWPIALQLAALSQVHAGPSERPTNAATQHIAEYLTDEVFACQPQALQQALLILAVPERFCVSVCAALIDAPDPLLNAESLLDQMRRANLFLIPLDHADRWYRFHHLFRDLLLRRLQLMVGRNGVRALQRRVAQWFAAENLCEEAVRFYLVADAEASAAELVEQQLIRETSFSGSNMRLDALLRLLPSAIIAQRPGLTLIGAHLAAVNLDLAALEAGLALTAAAQGALDDAERYAQSALQMANEIGGAFFRHQALGCAVRLALLRGDPAAAMHMAQQIAPDIHLGPSVWFETPRLSQAQAFIASGLEAHLNKADTILTACLSEVEALHNVRLLVRVLALQALLHEARGQRPTALIHLQRAVALAAPHMLVRALGDLGAALHPLIQKLSVPRSATAYLERVLALAAPALTDVHCATSVQLAGLPELLTRRELEILALLAERWSDKEIAERLVITPNTVRKHTSTIYDKLGIHSRREAVEAARALGMLSA